MAAGAVEELESGAVTGCSADAAGVGLQQQAGVGILGEGGGDADEGATASAGPMLLQGGVGAPVGQGGEIEVGGVAGEALGGPDGGEGAEQALVHGAGGAIGIRGKRGGLGQHVEAGEQAEAAIHAAQVVGAVAAGVGQLERDEGKHGLQGRQGAGAGVAGLGDRGVEAVAADPGQQAEQAGGTLGLEGLLGVRVEQDARGRAQARRSGGGALGAGAAGQALEAFLVQDMADGTQAGSVARLGVEAGLDVRNGEVRLAQFEHALAHVRQRQDGRAPGSVGGAEEERGRIVEAAEVAGHGIDRTDGIAEAPGDGLGGQVLSLGLFRRAILKFLRR